MSMINGTSSTDVLDQFRRDESRTGSKQDMGKNEFMELMIAQLNNQNPLEPQENGEFIADLAQFSSLEEMQNLSGTVGDVVGEFRSTQALQASAMVGRSVLAPSDQGMLGVEGGMSGVVNVPSSSSSVRVDILNRSGERVTQLELGESQAGQVPFAWDGNNSRGEKMPPGAYRVVAEGSYPEGTEQLGTLVSANVDSVSLGGRDGITLNLAGMGSIALSNVQQIN